MEFEYVDESEIEFSFTERKKKTPSLFDSEIVDRHFWGNDAGSHLVMGLARIAIRKEMTKEFYMDNIDSSDKANMLSKEHRNELKMFQLEILKEMMTKYSLKIIQFDTGDCKIIVLETFDVVKDFEEAI